MSTPMRLGVAFGLALVILAFVLNPSPQRHRALPPQPVGIDDGSRA